MFTTRSFTFISGARACPRTPFLFSSRTFTFQATRFAQSPARQAAKPNAKNTIKHKQQSATKPPTTTITPTQKNNARKEFSGMGKGSKVLIELEKKVISQKEVVLFKASSQRAYIFGAYGIAAFAFSYAIINSSIGGIQDSRVDLATWQKILYVGMCLVMSGMGTVFVGRTGRLIKNITAVNTRGKTLLNVTVRSMIPFRKPYTITVAPGQINFSRTLAVGSRLQPGVARTENVKVSWFKEPLRAVNYAFFRLFISIRRIFTQEDFVMMIIQGYKGAFRLGIDGYVSKDLLAIGGIRY